MIYCFEDSNYSTNTSMIDEKIQKDSSIIISSACDNMTANLKSVKNDDALDQISNFKDNRMNIENLNKSQPCLKDFVCNLLNKESDEIQIQKDMLSSLYCQENIMLSNEFCRDYMPWQSDITSHMRKVLVEYLFQVADNWNYSYSTFFTTVYILDNYLSKNQISRDQLQLIGISCLFASAKFHEVKPYSVSAYEFVCDGACTQKEILEFELLILISIDYFINVPTIFTFFETISSINLTDEPLIKYGVALLYKASLSSFISCNYDPSFIAQVIFLMTLIKFGKVSESHLAAFNSNERDTIIQLLSK